MAHQKRMQYRDSKGERKYWKETVGPAEHREPVGGQRARFLRGFGNKPLYFVRYRIIR